MYQTGRHGIGATNKIKTGAKQLKNKPFTIHTS